VLDDSKMRRMKQHRISSADRDELSRLVIDATDTDGVQRIVSKVLMLSPQAIHEVENVVGRFPHVMAGRLSRLWFRPATNRAVEHDPFHAPVLMFNRSGYVREAALKALSQLPDTPFFLAALVWRLNDWVGPVRRAAEDCATRELPRLSTRTIVGSHDRWGGAIFARTDASLGSMGLATGGRARHTDPPRLRG
jgi:hypothetical protein